MPTVWFSDTIFLRLALLMVVLDAESQIAVTAHCTGEAGRRAVFMELSAIDLQKFFRSQT